MRRLAFAGLLSCLCAAPVLATPPSIDTNSGWISGGNPLALTLTTTQANEVILVNTTPNGGLDLVTGITDTAGLTWIKRKRGGSSTNDLEEWYALSPGILVGDTITIHYSGGSGFFAIAWGVAGANMAAPFDVAVSGTPVGTGGPNACAITTLNSQDLILGLYRFSVATVTPGAGWSQLSGAGFNLVESQQFSSAQSNLTVAIGTGSTSVTGGVCDALAAAAGQTAEFSSKVNSYVVLNSATVMSSSKVNTYVVLAPATGADNPISVTDFGP